MTPCTHATDRSLKKALLRGSAACVLALGAHWSAQGQTTAPPPSSSAAQATSPGARLEQSAPPVSATTAARFIENCNEALQKGVVAPGCQAPIYRNELERLKQEAITTQNPNLLSFVGDAYRNPRSGFADMSQAYRWYLMAAVRGDPQAMQRLAEMNRSGQGVAKDNVKALGYARLTQRMTASTPSAKTNVASIVSELGDEMAVEEVALAERFAAQLEAQILRGEHAGRAGPASPPALLPVRPDPQVPGIQPPTATPAPGPAPSTPGTILPGVPSLHQR